MGVLRQEAGGLEIRALTTQTAAARGRVPVGMVRAWQSSGKKEGPQASGFTLGILATRTPPLLVPKGSELGRLSPQKAEGQGIELRQAHTDTATRSTAHSAPQLSCLPTVGKHTELGRLGGSVR